MRVALAIEHMDPGRGGREASTAQIARKLLECGCEVEILCQRGRKDAVAGASLTELGPSGGSRRRRLEGFLGELSRRFAGGGYDITHAMLPAAGADVYQLRGGTIPGQRAAAMRRRGVLAAALRGVSEPLNPIRRLLGRRERELVRDGGNWCLPVSAMVARELDTFYGRRDRVEVVFNGVDVPPISPERREADRRRLRRSWGLGTDAVVFLTAAMNPSLKGVDEAIRAFGCLGRTGVRETAPSLVVAGGRDERRLARLARRCGAGDRVIFTGQRETLFELYSAADACVLLSWYDPCSRVVLEAIRWRLPVLTTRFNGAAEAVLPADGREACGLVLDRPDEIGPAAEALGELCEADRRRRFADACDAVAAGLSMKQHVGRLLEVYRKILARRVAGAIPGEGKDSN